MVFFVDPGHADILDDNWAELARSVHFCSSFDGSHSFNEYRMYVGGIVASWLGVLNGNCKMMPYMKDASTFNTRAVVDIDGKVGCEKD